MFAAVESWRARQRPIPSQTAALRQLVELGLAAEPVGGVSRPLAAHETHEDMRE